MTRLTPLMWDALKTAHKHNGQLRRIHHPDTPGSSPWPAPAGTLRALERHGLMVLARVKNKDGLPTDVWSLSDKGREALDPPARHRQESKKWLGVKGHNSTRFMQYGVWKDATFPDADKEVDPAYLDPGWQERAQKDHREAETPRQLAARLVSELRSREQRRAA